jgi:hypothetical protein
LPWQGWFVDEFGYAATLRLDALLALVGLLALPWVRTSRLDAEPGKVALRSSGRA